MITPEQFSYSAEKKLLEILGNNASINAEILSFNRIAHRVSMEVGGYNKTNLSKAGKAMIVHSIMEKEKSKLKFLSKNSEDISVALSSISELKKHNILPQDIKNVGKQIDDIYLQTKLNDIDIIYSSYQEIIKNKYIDEEDVLSILAEQIKDSTMFDNSYIYVDEFIGFTAQEYEILRELEKKAKEINITICMDTLNGQNGMCSEIFNSSRKVVKKLSNIIAEKKINFIELKEKVGFNSKEIIYVENNIFKNIVRDKYMDNVYDITLSLMQNPYSEVENVAKQIMKLVRDEKYDFKDIIIISKNIEEHEALVKAIFANFNIPVFIDKNGELSSNSFIKYVLAIIEIFQKNWSKDAMISYIKTGFTSLTGNETYKLENYCCKWGIKGKKWLEEWKYEDENTPEMELLRGQIINPLIKLKDSLGCKKTANEITTALYNFIESNGIIEKINNKIDKFNAKGYIEIAKEYKASFDILVAIFDEISLIFGEDNINFEKYKELLKIGLNNSNLGRIPTMLNQVLLADMNRSKPKNAKAVFILEMNDGIYPSVNKSEGFFNDKDRENLAGLNIEMADGTLENLYEEELNIYKVMSLPSDKLFLSYVSSDKDGNSKRPSILINKIKKIFPKLVEESDIINKKSEISSATITFKEMLEKLRQKQEGEEIDEVWYDVYKWFEQNNEWNDKLKIALKGLNYKNDAEQITIENIKALYGENLNVSVSRLEQYRKCPFSFHLKYGMKLKEKEEFKLKPIDTGTFMHDVIDTFFETRRDYKELSNDEIESIVNEIIDEKLNLKKNYIFTSNAKFVVLTNRLKKVVIKALLFIVEQMKHSDFEILGNEVEFRQKYDNVTLTGKIDRMDIAKNEDGEYIRIVDYKSSEKDINLNELSAGIQIQLLTYIDSIATKYNKIPAGVLYFNLIDPIVKSDRNLPEEKIEERIRKEFKMNGLVLADIKVVKMMDTSFDGSQSDYVPARIMKTTGEFSKSGTVSKEEFSKLREIINKLIREISSEITKGKIDISPIYNKKSTSCDYCEFKTICGFNPNYNKYRIIENKSREEILWEQ